MLYIILVIILLPVFLFFEIGFQAKEERKKRREWWKNR